MKKVLVLTYYWPPGGGSGVQRWLKFTKYLRKFGWEPVVYTAKNGEMPVKDDSLLNDIPERTEIIRTNVWEPYSIYKFVTGKKQTTKINTSFTSDEKGYSVTDKISVWIRGNLFIPDARKFWINPSVNHLKKYLKKNNIDVMVSSGPPHSMHMIALKLKLLTGIPWIADFRDPWTKIDFYNELRLSRWADRKHHNLEKQVLQKADAVVAVSRQMAREFEEIRGKTVDLITNGFDRADLPVNPPEPDPDFTIVHIGSIPASRNPVTLWKVLEGLTALNQLLSEKLQVKLIGKIDYSIRESIKESGLEKYTVYIDYLPHHLAVNEQLKARVLLLLINNTPGAEGILTGKFFEYLAARRPILAIGPEKGEVATILDQTKSGQIVDFQDHEKLKTAILQLFDHYQDNSFRNSLEEINKYSREELTKQMALVMDRVRRTK